MQNYERSLERSRLARTRLDRPSVFSFQGEEWDLLPEVFAPQYSPSTGAAMGFLGLIGPDRVAPPGSFLEIGAGSGVIAVTAALAGATRVVATDVNPQAVRNTRMNAERHGVADRVEVVESDLFAGLDPGEQFDTVFWSTPYVRAPEEFQFTNAHDRAYVDPGYATHRRFLAEAGKWVTDGGSVLLHFSGRGDLPALLRFAGEAGQGLRAVRSTFIREGEFDVEHVLLEIAPCGRRA
ncbi:50S ribosomal protein L11 methyltransferase [Lentzea sp. NPDC055074]